MAKLLLVDDDDSTLEYLQDFCQHCGFSTAIAATCAQALELLDSTTQVLVTDFHIDVSFDEYMSQVRAKFPNLPVVLLAGMYPPNVDAICQKWNIAARLEKPIENPEEFPLLIKRLTSP